MFELAAISGMFIVFAALIGKGMGKVCRISKPSSHHPYSGEEIKNEAQKTYELLRSEREKDLKWIEESKKRYS
jgi:hypothetical protein